jgi:hypothetical protein
LPNDEFGSILAANAAKMPVLPVYPTHNHCIFNNLASDPHHGMEEVIGSNQNRRLHSALKPIVHSAASADGQKSPHFA